MRSVRNKAAAGAFAAILAAGAFAAPSVEITNVQQQYPWTNTVDITYTVQGVNKTHQTNRLDHIVNDTYFATFEAKSGSTPIADVNCNTIFTNGLVQGNGTFTAQWHPAMDQQLTGCTMTPSVFRGEENAYLVINLVTNKNGKYDYWYEPMSTQEASNQRYNTDEYKTTKLVLRRIKAGTYKLGAQSYTGNYDCSTKNSFHEVVIPEDYFAGIFEITEAQYARIIDSTTGLNSKLPVGNINWTTIRGTAFPQSVPAGFFEKMCAKLYDGFDLPTESMWEVAARAGRTTRFISGDAGSVAEGITKYAWLPQNFNIRIGTGFRAGYGGYVHDVGLLKANAWGLFDVTGNVWEWVRDASRKSGEVGDLSKFATQKANGLVPLQTSDTGDSNNAMIKGGGLECNAATQRSMLSNMYIWTKNTSGPHVGFRVFWTPWKPVNAPTT